MRLLVAVFLFVPAVLVLAACAGMSTADRDDPRYIEGYEMGREAAEEDRITMDCSDRRLGTQSVRRLRSYESQWEKAGRSAAFVSGFRYGYREGYRENIVTMCD